MRKEIQEMLAIRGIGGFYRETDSGDPREKVKVRGPYPTLKKARGSAFGSQHGVQIDARYRLKHPENAETPEPEELEDFQRPE